jgi:DNA-binding NarL/FixJ family response regulator
VALEVMKKSVGKPHTVLLVEDNDATRDRLARAVDGSPGLRLIGVASTCREARERLDNLAPEVLLVDLGLPDGSGIDVIREAKRRHARTEAMVITVFGDEKHVVSAIEAGATGYILKDGSNEYIGESIRELLRGGSPISPAIARHLLRRFQDSPPPPPDGEAQIPGLTEREREVLRLLVKGFTFQEIGGLLAISAHTVTTHVKHIYEKLEVRSRAEAVYEALQLGILKDET